MRVVRAMKTRRKSPCVSGRAQCPHCAASGTLRTAVIFKTIARRAEDSAPYLRATRLP
jgi:hypothetical protein